MAVLLTGGAVRAEPWTGWGPLERDFQERMQAQVAARLARLPHPIAIHWKPRRIADFDFGATVLAAVAVDLQAGGQDELAILTARELVVLGGIGERRAEVVARLDLDGPAAVPAARDPIGQIAVVQGEGGTKLWMRSSDFKEAHEVAAKLPLRISGHFAGIPLCPPDVGRIVPGRNLLFANGRELPPLFYAARCVRGFFDEQGRATRGRAVLDTAGSLSVSLATCASDEVCDAAAPALEVPDIGSAFAAADVDRDGLLEIVGSSSSPPGAKERVSIYEARAGSLKAELKEDFALGAAAIVIGQFDDDEELEVVSLHRRFRRSKVEVWLWN